MISPLWNTFMNFLFTVSSVYIKKYLFTCKAKCRLKHKDSVESNVSLYLCKNCYHEFNFNWCLNATKSKLNKSLSTWTLKFINFMHIIFITCFISTLKHTTYIKSYTVNKPKSSKCINFFLIILGNVIFLGNTRI